MNANTAVVRERGRQAGAMVRSATSMYVYWVLPEQGAPLAVQICDLSGRPAPDLIDGTGVRTAPVAIGETGIYLENLLPGHIYAVALGERRADGFAPLLTLPSVQTPWHEPAPEEARPDFPHQYHRS